MFGRATITLGIGPHSSWHYFTSGVTGCQQLLQAVAGRVPAFGDDALVVAKYVHSAVDVIRTSSLQADVNKVQDRLL